MLLAALLWAGGAMADEPAPQTLAVGGADGIEVLSMDELSAASGGYAVSQTSVVDQGLTVSGGNIEVNNGQLNTGAINSQVGNSGGVNNVMLNSGNNVNFQNSTVLNIYLGPDLP